MSGQRSAPASREDALREIRAVELALAAGHPISSPNGDRRSRSAVRAAAEALGVNRISLAHRIGTPEAPGSHTRRFSLSPNWTLASERGHMGTRPVLPGFAISSTSTQLGPDGDLKSEWIRQRKAPSTHPFEMLPGHVVKGESSLVDGEGRVLAKWVKTREGADPLDVVATIKAAFADYEGGATPTPAPGKVAADKLALLPCADWHVGMFAWGAEAGSNWDLKLAEGIIGGAVEEAVANTEPCGHAIVLGGGDLLHADNSDNRTARSGNALQVDGRYQKVLMAASRLMVRTVEACLRRHGHVTVRILPGNHDEHASVAVAYFLLAWFRDEPRVTVDVDPSLFFWFRFGDVLLGATHGHNCKITDMPSIMAHRRAEDWGQTRHRFVHGFHLHHSAKFQTEGQGVISEIHQSPVPQDAWHFGSGFLSGRSIQTITYHRRFGEISRARVAIMDGERNAA